MAKNNALQQLNLSRNKVGPEGAKALAGALERNNALQQLNLSKNEIGHEEAKALAVALATNNTLQELCLYWNSIGEEGTKAFVKTMMENTNLTRLDISPFGNNYNDAIQFFVRLNRKGRFCLCSPTPIPLSVWREVVRGPQTILYFLLRERADVL